MKILLLTSEYPPNSWGGLGRYSYEVCKEMRTRFEVDILNIPSYYINISYINKECNPGVRVDDNGTMEVTYELRKGL